MKLKYSNYIPDVSTFKFIDDALFFIDTINYNLFKYNLSNFSLEWNSNSLVGEIHYYNRKIYTYDFYEYNLRGERLKLKDISLKLSHENREQMELSKISTEGLVLIETWEGETVYKNIFSLDKEEFVAKNIKIKPFVAHLNELVMVLISKGVLKIYNYLTNVIILEKDFSEICSYYDDISERVFKGEISKTYIYDRNKIIVTTKHSNVYCFDLFTGNLIWESTLYAKNIEIVGNLGYVCTGLSLYKINLKDGSKSGYGWDNHKLPKFNYNQETYWPSGDEIVYYNDLLWYPVYSSGQSFILVINPNNGEYQQILYIDIKEKIVKIVFYKDQMYLHDSGNVLHIYDAELN